MIGSFITVYFTILRPVSNTEAFSSSNTSSYKQVGELLKAPTTATGNQPFNANMTTLINMIYGSAGNATTQVAELQSQLVEADNATEPNAISAKALRAKTYNKTNGQSIVVRLGGLDWIVTYVSTDTSGNLVATLWLSNNHQDAWSGRNDGVGSYYGFVSGGLYSDWSADWYNGTAGTYPSNMYGTSYIRVETLNNPSNRTYATSNSALTNGTTQSTTHPFALYTVASKGLTNYITTPDQMKWMINRQNPSAWGVDSYWRSNNSLTSGNAYSYSCSWYNSSYNYESNTSYANWGKDYLWLPSMEETGDNDTNDGFWETNTAERTTYDGSTTKLTASSAIGSSSNSNGNSTTASLYSWSRSASNDYASDSYYLYPSGSGCDGNIVYLSPAVRPALLLTLNSAVEHSALPLNITLDQQGGLGGTASVIMAEGGILPNITAPTKTSYAFVGYYTSTNGGGTKIYNADGTPVISASTFTADTTLYAYWIHDRFDITTSTSGSSAKFTTKILYVPDSENAKIIVIPQANFVVTAFSFDNTNWYFVEHYKAEIYDTGVSLSVVYGATTKSNIISLEFYTLLYNYQNPSKIPIYLRFASGSTYVSLKKPVGGGVSGVALQSTYGGTATIVGADLESMGDDDTIIVSADMVMDGYAFMYWMDESGNKLSYDQSVKFKKKDAMDSVVTAVFAPIGTDPNTYTVVDNSE